MPIERLSPALDDTIGSDVIHMIDPQGFSFGGSEGPAEGPLWWSDPSEEYSGHLPFSDMHDDRRMRFTLGRGLPEDGHKHLGSLTVEAHAACQPSQRSDPGPAGPPHYRRARRFHRRPDKSVQSRQLNRPSDMVINLDGSTYFTGPWPSVVPGSGGGRPLPASSVYPPTRGTLTLHVGDFVVPNGLHSHPMKASFISNINDSHRSIIRAFDVQDDCTLALASDRQFADMRPGDREGILDGMKVDSEGNVCCGVPVGSTSSIPAGRAWEAPFTNNSLPPISV